MLSNCIKIKRKSNLINNHNSNLIYNNSNKNKTRPITRISGQWLANGWPYGNQVANKKEKLLVSVYLFEYTCMKRGFFKDFYKLQFYVKRLSCITNKKVSGLL